VFSVTSNVLKLAKATINEAQSHITINFSFFDKINLYLAGWLSGANPEVLQLTDVGNAINKSVEKIKPTTIKIIEDKQGRNLTQNLAFKQSVTQQQSPDAQRWPPQST
jgi:hypothetical protein